MDGCKAGINGDCGRKVYARSLCKAHYNSALQGKNTNYEIAKYAKHNAQTGCEVEDCEREFYADGKCKPCYMKAHRERRKKKEQL